MDPSPAPEEEKPRERKAIPVVADLLKAASEHFQFAPQPLRRETMFARFARDIYLEQNAWLHPFFIGNTLQILGERERVDPVKHFEERESVADFVLLQVPDEMPTQP